MLPSLRRRLLHASPIMAAWLTARKHALHAGFAPR